MCWVILSILVHAWRQVRYVDLISLTGRPRGEYAGGTVNGCLCKLNNARPDCANADRSRPSNGALRKKGADGISRPTAANVIHSNTSTIRDTWKHSRLASHESQSL
ncbi:hypothetical protein AcV5_008523 [Taiwanofungus camphoratus]|nr:hypothetical protein AcV5_008523 [Antrodia cinnamomea]